MVKTASGWRGVIQRVAPTQVKGKGTRSKAATRVLYRLVDRVKVAADLRFIETITREVQARHSEVMAAAMEQALRTMR